MFKSHSFPWAFQTGDGLDFQRTSQMFVSPYFQSQWKVQFCKGPAQEEALRTDSWLCDLAAFWMSGQYLASQYWYSSSSVHHCGQDGVGWPKVTKGPESKAMSYFNNNRKERGRGREGGKEGGEKRREEVREEKREGGTSVSGFWNLMVSVCTHGSKMSALAVSAALHCVCLWDGISLHLELTALSGLSGWETPGLLLSLPPGCWGFRHKSSR